MIIDAVPDAAGSMTESEPLTVAALTREIEGLFKSHESFQKIAVVGEISNFKHHMGRHMYFSLKDEGASIRCVCFEGANRKLTFKPKDGMQVVAFGHLGVYPQSGNYQLYVKGLRETGMGALYRDFEILKKKLMAEGLTASERKRDLPSFPRRIGIVFSSESAGFRDIVNVLSRRFPLAEVVLESVAVEGVASAPSIVRGLERMAARCVAAHGRVDVVIVGRGGGSIESLWAFNTEPVARAIAAMPVPVISAVGHETDVTIADLVADRRAATPTEAAELATPSVDEIRDGLARLEVTIRDGMGRGLRRLRERLALIGRALRSPESLVDFRSERSDRLRESLDRSLARLAALREQAVKDLVMRLGARSPERRVLQQAALFERSGIRLRHAATRLAELRERRLTLLETRLRAADPTAIMERGYAVVMSRGRALKNAAEVAPGDRVAVRLHKGALDCEVKEAG